MHNLRSSTLVRWFVFWILGSLLIAGGASLLTLISGKPNTLASGFIKGFLSTLVFSSPLFLFGGVLTQFVNNQKNYTSIKRIIYALVLVALFAAAFFDLAIITTGV